MKHAGRHVVLYGRRGGGKSTVLAGVRSALLDEGVACAMSEHTASLCDVTSALARAYALQDASRFTRRRVRAVLQLRADRERSALLLDDVRAERGISDLEALTRDTHKFESHYDRCLIGPYPESRDVFVGRSPIHHVDRIARPVVFFQGLDDKVVPADQTERMANALRARGVKAEYHGYEGEQHGFRKAETIRHVIETELRFFRSILGAA